MERENCDQCGRIMGHSYKKIYCSIECEKESKIRKPLMLWIECNDCTWKHIHRGTDIAIAWIIRIKDEGWFIRIKDETRNWSAGPFTVNRAKQVAETLLRHQPFKKREGEYSWNGDCTHIL